MRKWLWLLRAFFPSWRFFDEIGAELRLEFRPDEQSEWRRLVEPIPRRIRNVLVNPRGNFGHAVNNLTHHLHADAAAHPHAVEGLTSYRLVRHLVERLSGTATRYQFRLVAISGDQVDEILRSPVYGSAR